MVVSACYATLSCAWASAPFGGCAGGCNTVASSPLHMKVRKSVLAVRQLKKRHGACAAVRDWSDGRLQCCALWALKLSSRSKASSVPPGRKPGCWQPAVSATKTDVRTLVVYRGSARLNVHQTHDKILLGLGSCNCNAQYWIEVRWGKWESFVGFYTQGPHTLGASSWLASSRNVSLRAAVHAFPTSRPSDRVDSREGARPMSPTIRKRPLRIAKLCSLDDKATMMRPSSYRYGASDSFSVLAGCGSIPNGWRRCACLTSSAHGRSTISSFEVPR